MQLYEISNRRLLITCGWIFNIIGSRKWRAIALWVPFLKRCSRTEALVVKGGVGGPAGCWLCIYDPGLPVTSKLKPPVNRDTLFSVTGCRLLKRKPVQLIIPTGDSASAGPPCMAVWSQKQPQAGSLLWQTETSVMCLEGSSLYGGHPAINNIWSWVTKATAPGPVHCSSM